MEDIVKLEENSINSKGYGIIPRAVMQDKRLNVIAKAIYAYLRSFTGSENNCCPTRDNICDDLGITKDTLTKHMKTLIEMKYVSILQKKDNGKFSHNVYVIHETVSQITVSENTVSENLGHGDINLNNNIYNTTSTHSNISNYSKNSSTKYKLTTSTYTNSNIQSKNSSSKYKLPTSIYTLDNIYTIEKYKEKEIYKEKEKNNENFDRFWKAYPKKSNKGSALKWFEKNKPSKELVDKMINQINRFKDTKQWKEKNGQFIPYPSTWLNGKRWEDEFETDEEKNERLEKEMMEGIY